MRSHGSPQNVFRTVAWAYFMELLGIRNDSIAMTGLACCRAKEGKSQSRVNAGVPIE